MDILIQTKTNNVMMGILQMVMDVVALVRLRHLRPPQQHVPASLSVQRVSQAMEVLSLRRVVEAILLSIRS